MTFAPKKKDAAAALDRARQALTETSVRIVELEAARKSALLNDEDTKAAALDAQIEEQKRLERVHRDKVALLQKEADRELNEKRLREQDALIRRVEAKFAKLVDIATALSEKTQEENQLACRYWATIQEILAAWNWQQSDKPALMLGRDVFLAHLGQERFRISAQPPKGGGMDQGDPLAGFQLPGSRILDLRYTNLPSAIQPLPERVKEIAAFASQIMRGQRSTIGVQAIAGNGAAAPERERTASDVRLTALLEKQAQLPAIAQPTPGQEQAYGELIAEISKASAAAEMEKI